jgi:hypothetical protein
MNKGKKRLRAYSRKFIWGFFLCGVLVIPLLANALSGSGFISSYAGYVGTTILSFILGVEALRAGERGIKPVLYCEPVKLTEAETGDNNFVVMLKNCGLGPANDIEVTNVQLVGLDAPYEALPSIALLESHEIQYLVDLRRVLDDVSIDAWADKSVIRGGEKEEWILKGGASFELQYKDCEGNRYQSLHTLDIRVRDRADVYPVQEVINVLNNKPEKVSNRGKKKRSDNNI